MDYYPIFLKLEHYRTLVVGGGSVATRKALALIDAGGAPLIVAPEISAELSKALMKGQATYIAKQYSAEDLANIQLVIAATSSKTVNRQISADARARGILVNVVDDTEACGFIVPSIVDRSPILVAISSAGKAPVLARLIRQKLESLIPAAYSQLATLAGSMRNEIKARVRSGKARRRFWEWFFSGVASRAVLNHQPDLALDEVSAYLSKNASDEGKGEVYLVGAGPGDPELITLKALRLMQQADVVLHDNLVSPQVLNLVRRDADRISVAKKKGCHSVEQESINEMMVRLASEGKRVCRLKGGDPFVFGRGGEELETLAANGIDFQVVPGISAANGCAAYAGIPLTHRDYADSVSFLTAHKKNGAGLHLPPDISNRTRQTIVFYMGLSRLNTISNQLQRAGFAANLPVAAVQSGATHQQKVLITNLRDLDEAVGKAQLHSPTLIIVGQVVSLARTLHWFGDKPMFIKNQSDHADQFPAAIKTA